MLGVQLHEAQMNTRVWSDSGSGREAPAPTEHQQNAARQHHRCLCNPRSSPMVTPSSSQPSLKDLLNFEALVNERACACDRPKCHGVLRDYYLDPAPSYPNPSSPHLFFKIESPPSNLIPGRRSRRSVNGRRKTVPPSGWALGVTDGKTMVVAIHHFARLVIEAFADDPNSGTFFP